TSTVSVPYRNRDRVLAQKIFVVYRTHHGPIVQKKDGKWVSIALMQRPVEALCQSFLLTKAHDFASFMKVMELRANSSNNTVFARNSMTFMKDAKSCALVSRKDWHSASTGL